MRHKTSTYIAAKWVLALNSWTVHHVNIQLINKPKKTLKNRKKIKPKEIPPLRSYLHFPRLLKNTYYTYLWDRNRVKLKRFTHKSADHIHTLDGRTDIDVAFGKAMTPKGIETRKEIWDTIVKKRSRMCCLCNLLANC